VRTDELEQLVAVPGSVGERRADHSRGSLDLLLPEPSPVVAQPPFPAADPAAGGEQRVVAGRDDVNRRPHQRGLDGLAPLERAREVAQRKSLET
jgi:hypothetical protein